jgi:hypothetical protein
MDTSAKTPIEEEIVEEQHAAEMDSAILAHQVHESVFAPDQCELVRASKLRKLADDTAGENSNGTRASGVSSSSSHRCWHSSLNEKLFPGFADLEYDELAHANQWSVERVVDFVTSLPSCPPTVADKFRQEQIDGEAFLLLTQHDIVKLMNIRLGPAVKIFNAVMFLKHRRLNDTK